MSIAPHVVRFGAALLDFVYPPHCPVCDVWQPPDDREPVCRVCINSLLATIGPRCDRCSAPLKAPSSSGSSCPNCVSWRGIHFDRALVLADFSGVAGDAIHSLKFSGIKKIGPFLGRQMAGHPDLRAGLAALDLLIPVPLHAARQRERGHNQAKEIALGLSESLGIPLDDGCCASLPADATAGPSGRLRKSRQHRWGIRDDECHRWARLPASALWTTC